MGQSGLSRTDRMDAKPRRRRVRRRPWLISALLICGFAAATATTAQPTPQVKLAATSGDPVIAAVGDIACDPSNAAFNVGLGDPQDCQQKATAALLAPGGAIGTVNAVLPLGDEQYNCGALSAFQQVYDPTWGTVKSITSPVPGNHEYQNTGGTGCSSANDASGYFSYFGASAGDPSKGYYSFDIGAWHIIALNSEQCFGQTPYDQTPVTPGCQAGSAQELWLKQDLANNHNACTLAYWHEPRYSSTAGQGDDTLNAFYADLYNAHADVVLNGHQHFYERFGLQDMNAKADPNGIREFIVGTGGESLMALSTPRAPNSQVSDDQTFGVLKMTLHGTSYDWKYVPIAGSAFTDSGTTQCHGNPAPDTTAPTTTSAISPAPNAAGWNNTSPASVLLSATDIGTSGVSKTYYTTNGTTPTTASPAYTGPIPVTATTTVKFFSVDKAGNAEAVKSQLVRMDTTPPVSNITCNAAACAASYAAAVTVRLSAADTGGSGVSAIRYTTDGTDPSSSATAKTYTTAFAVSASSTVKYISLDAAGNAEPTKAQPILIKPPAGDHTPPNTSIKCNATSCSSGYYTSSVSVTLSATDTGGSGLASTRYTTDGSNPVNSATAKVYTAAFPVAATTTVNYYSTDKSGNAEVVQSQLIQVDTAAPTTAISCNGAACATWYRTSPVTVSLTSTDTGGSGTSAMRYTTDGTDPRTSSTAVPYTAPFAVAATATVRAASLDAAGNFGVTAAQPVQIDIFTPTTPLKCGTQGDPCNPNITYPNPTMVTLSASDAGGSGIAQTKYTLDGSDPATSPTAIAYTAPINLAQTTTLKAFSVDVAGNVEDTNTILIHVAFSSGGSTITAENQLPGTTDWQFDGLRADDITQQIKGYASATSINIGQPVTFYVTVNPAQQFTLDIYRMGYYQNRGGRLMLHVPNLNGIKQATCPMDPTTGEVACSWSASYTLNVPASWLSGVYMVKLTNAQNFESYIPFVVRDDSRHSALLYQQSVTTYEAYNNYPEDGPNFTGLPATGKSLYDYNSSAAKTGAGTQRATKVSFDRPYSAESDGAGQYFEFEAKYVRWLEQNGYDVTYATNIDTAKSGSLLLNHNGFLSVGHDEYWTKSMFDNVSAARDQGVNVAFFGGNDVYWQARLESSASGVADRVLVCYKDTTLDPVKDSTATVRWRDPAVNRPEQQLIGLTGTGQQPDGAPPASFIATNTSNWVYAGTGLTDNTSVAKIVGYETDRYINGYKAPTAAAGTYTLLSSSPYTTSTGATEYQQSSVYQAPSGAWVFAAGSIEWSFGLYNDGSDTYADPRIQQMTANVLNRFVAGSKPLPLAPSGLTAVPTSSSIELSWTDNASDETGYLLDRSTSPSFQSVTSVDLPANTTSYSDPGLDTGVYYYRLRTVNANGNSPYVLVSASTVPYGQLIDTESGLRSHWRLGEASGTTAADRTGALAGTYGTGASPGSPGAIANDPDTAAAFDGTPNARVTFPTQQTVTDFSVEGWSYLTGTAMNNTVYGGNGTVRILARPGTPNSPTAAYAGVWLNGTEYALQPTTSESNLNQWVHWVLTRSGATLTLYRDGVLIGQRTDLPATATADVSGWIGTQSNGSAYPLTGRIDEVALYTSALTVEQVASHYAAGENAPAPLPVPQLPLAPDHLSAAPTPNSVALSWTDNATDETGYLLERSTSPSFQSVTSVNLPANATSYSDTGLAAGVYYYRLSAVNTGGNSPYAFVSASTVGYGQLVDTQSSLRAHWRLGEPSGTTAWDTTGSVNGAYGSGVSLGGPGAIANDPDTAATFDGTSNARITLPLQQTVTDFSVEGWSYLTAASPMNNTVYGGIGTVRILARPGTPNSPTAAYAGVWLNATEYVLQPTTSQSNLNQWVHWVLTRQGNTLTLYRDGVLIGQRTDLPATATADISGWIGTQSNGSAFPLTGRIDEVALYTSALTSDEVANHYAAGENAPAPTATPPPPAYADLVSGTSGLTDYWRLGEASGTVAKDAKGTADGTYVNGVTLGSAGAIGNDPDTAATFNGTNQRLTLPSLPTTVDFTIEGWTYLTNASSTNNTLYGANGKVRLLARPGASGSTAAYAGVWLNGIEYVLQPNSAASNVNTWVHWVLTRQGSTLSLYRDAVLIGQRTDLPATATADISGAIGAQGGVAYFLAGRIDDVALYNTALDTTNITAHYRAATTGPGLT